MKPETETNPGTSQGRAWRRLPLQNLALAAFVIGMVAGAAQLLNVHTGFPFGHCYFAENAGPRWLGGFPIWLPLVWVVVLLSARGTAQLLLRAERQSPNYGCWLLVVAAALATLTQAALDLFGTQVMHWWRWTSAGWSWEGVALPNLAGSFLASAVALLLATPALIDKRPVQPPPGVLPLVVWFALNTVFMAGSLSPASDAVVAVLAAPVAIVAVLAFQRNRGLIADCGNPPRSR